MSANASALVASAKAGAARPFLVDHETPLDSGFRRNDEGNAEGIPSSLNSG